VAGAGDESFVSFEMKIVIDGAVKNPNNWGHVRTSAVDCYSIKGREEKEYMATNSCCAECGEEGGVGLKTCKSCMLVKYCNAECQKKHWPKHKKLCKERAAELRDEALFKDPPSKEDCPICFLPMPVTIVSCALLPTATISSVPIHDFSNEHEELASMAMEQYYSCCGKSICGGCVHSFRESGNIGKCPFCIERTFGKTDEELFEELMKRVEVNDAGATFALGSCYRRGQIGLQQNEEKAIELFTKSAELGCSDAIVTWVTFIAKGDI